MVAPRRMYAADKPQLIALDVPHLPLGLPGILVVGRQCSDVPNVLGIAAPPLDAGIADIDDDDIPQATTSWTVCNCSRTRPTSFASPCPVTAEIASTSLPSSCSIRADRKSTRL